MWSHGAWRHGGTAFGARLFTSEVRGCFRQCSCALSGVLGWRTGEALVWARFSGKEKKTSPTIDHRKLAGLGAGLGWGMRTCQLLALDVRLAQVQGFLRLCFTSFGLPAASCHPAVWYQRAAQFKRDGPIFRLAKPRPRILDGCEGRPARLGPGRTLSNCHENWMRSLQRLVSDQAGIWQLGTSEADSRDRS